MIQTSQSVLVADDDQYFRLALAGLLKGPLGFQTVIETGSFDEALERLSEASGHISLALFDLSMPGMEGPTTLGAVRECHPEVRVAVVSASQDRHDVLSALETGVHGYIPKSLGPGELIRALKFIIEGDIFVPAFLARLSPEQKEQQFGKPKLSSLGTAARRGAATDRSQAGLILSMSPRQQEVLGLLVRGFSNKQMANELSLGEGTVKIHVAALLRNLGVSNRAAAAAAGAVLLRA